jgi:hypothetical protein
VPTNNATAIRENRERLRESMDHLVARKGNGPALGRRPVDTVYQS